MSVNELKQTAQNTRVGPDVASTGVVLEDEMTLDAPASSAAFDESLDKVSCSAFSGNSTMKLIRKQSTTSE